MNSTCAVLPMLACAAFVVVSSPIEAQTTQPSTTTATTTVPVVIQPWSHFDDQPRRPAWHRQGSWEGSLGIGGMTFDADHHDTLGYFQLGGGYFLTDRLSLNIEADLTPGRRDSFSFGSEDDNRNDLADGGLWGYGGIATGRAELIRVPPLFLYADAGLGGFHTHRGFPRRAARNNWLKLAGMGVQVQLAGNVYLSLGARYARLSPRLFETSGSPAFNGVQYYAGITFSW